MLVVQKNTIPKDNHISDNKNNKKMICEKKESLLFQAFVFVIFGRHSHNSQDASE